MPICSHGYVVFFSEHTLLCNIDISWSQFQTLYQSCALQVRALSELRTQLVLALHASPPADARIAELSIRTLTRHVTLFGKFFRRLQQLEASRFVQLPLSSELVLWYWNTVVEATGGPVEYIEGKWTMLYILILSYDLHGG